MTHRFALALTLLAALSTGALAHSKREGTTPEDGAVVGEVPELTLAFDSPMRVVMVELTRDGTAVEIDRETGMEPVTAFRAVPTAPLAPGTYRLEWRGMAADGHPMQGGFGFTVSE